MRNGLYSIHIHMLDGVQGRDSGVIILRDGKLISGGPYFWSTGTYTSGNGTWKGQLVTIHPAAVCRTGSRKRIYRNLFR
jgi:hypothetical protein